MIIRLINGTSYIVWSGTRIDVLPDTMSFVARACIATFAGKREVSEFVTIEDGTRSVPLRGVVAIEN